MQPAVPDPPPGNPILVAFDGSPSARTAASWAVAEAASSGRPLRLAHVMRWPLPEVDGLDLPASVRDPGRARQAARDLVHAAVARCKQIAPEIDIRGEALTGATIELLAELAAEASMLVLGASGQTTSPQVLLGSSASELARRVTTPVAVIRDIVGDSPGQAVVIGVDGSIAGARATHAGFHLAARRRLRVVAVHTWSDLPIEALGISADVTEARAREDGAALLATQLAEIRRLYPQVQVDEVVAVDRPTRALLHHAAGAALLVVGRHGRARSADMPLGSVNADRLRPRPPSTRTGRLPELDNLKAVLVAWIIVGHALLGYVAFGGWEYSEVREVTFSPTTELVLSGLFGPSALVVIGTLFLVAGLFLPGALAVHGVRRFVTQRLARLGGPYLAFALLLWPLLLWSTYRAAGRDVSYRWIAMTRQPLLDAGALWFAGVLLIFSLGYAGLVRVGLLRAEVGTSAAGPVRARHVAAVAAVIAVATFLVRLRLPAMGHLPGDLHLWEWPQCLGLLGLGVFGARHGLLRSVPEPLHRASGRVVVVCLVTMPLVAAATGAHDVAGNLAPYLGGWSWQALYAATVEGVLVVTGSLWLLGSAQRRLTNRGPVAHAAGRAAFAAYILQGPVLLGLAVAARPLPVPVLVKATIVGAVGVTASFALAWFLVSRTELGRIL